MRPRTRRVRTYDEVDSVDVYRLTKQAFYSLFWSMPLSRSRSRSICSRKSNSSAEFRRPQLGHTIGSLCSMCRGYTVSSVPQRRHFAAYIEIRIHPVNSGRA